MMTLRELVRENALLKRDYDSVRDYDKMMEILHALATRCTDGDVEDTFMADVHKAEALKNAIEFLESKGVIVNG